MAGEKRRFKYQAPTKERLRQMANASSGDFDNYIKQEYKLYKPKDGKNLIRVLPATWEEGAHYAFEVWLNYGVGPDKNTYLSLSKMKGERDPLDEAFRLAQREGDEELAKQLKPRKRQLMWVIDRTNEEEGPLIWPAPHTVAKAFATLAIDEDTGGITRVDSPGAVRDCEDDGHDIRFYKEGQGLNTEYDPAKMKIQAASPLSDDDEKADQWMTYVEENPIPDCLQFYPYEHIAAVFNGAGLAKAEAEDDPPLRKTAPTAAPAKAKPVEAEAEEAPWVDPDEQPEEPEEKPAPKARPKLAKPEADEEPEERLSIRERIRARAQRAVAQD